MVKNPNVSIIVVYYNGLEDLKECLESLSKQSLKDFEVIIINNSGSKLIIDNSPLHQGFVGQAKFNQNFKFKIQNSPSNLGFAGGCNLGAKSAKGEYIALLNPDMIIDKMWLENLVKTLKKNQQAGIAVGKIYHGLPGDKIKYIDSAGSLYNQIGSAWSRGYLEIDKGQFDQVEEVPMATAGAFLFRKKILEKTYLFDESFFMYMEEFDFCIRIRQLGNKIIYQPKAISYHKFSQSVKSENIGKKTILFKQFYGNRARAKILLKYYPWSIILRNLHLIIASFLYWDIYFIFNGGLAKFVDLEKNFRNFANAGLAQRKKYAYQTNWTKYITYQNLFELINWHKTAGRREKNKV